MIILARFRVGVAVGRVRLPYGLTQLSTFPFQTLPLCIREGREGHVIMTRSALTDYYSLPSLCLCPCQISVQGRNLLQSVLSLTKMSPSWVSAPTYLLRRRPMGAGRGLSAGVRCQRLTLVLFTFMTYG